jgi:probable HAF family extracellular repeat protein
MNRIRWGLRVACAIAATIAIAAPAFAQNYTITDLGVLSPTALGGLTTTADTGSRALAINASGSVVGYSGLYDVNDPSQGFGGQHAFLWTPGTPNGTTGTMVYLGGLPGGYCYSPEHTVGGFTTPASYDLQPTFAYDINSAGQVVGSSYTSSDGICFPDPNDWIHGVLWQNGTAMDLGVPPWIPPPFAAPLSIEATSINDLGQIVGDVNNADAWFYDGSFHDVRSFPGFPNTLLNKINSGGAMVGNSQNTSVIVGLEHTGTGPIQATDALGTLGGSSSDARGINEAGLIVGASTTASGSVHAFSLYPGGAMFDLGTASKDPLSNSAAIAINRANDIVGFSTVDPANAWMSCQHAVMWEDGGNLIDLNSLLLQNALPPVAPPVGTPNICSNPNPSPNTCEGCWELTSANGINDLGQIVGEGLYHGQLHAFLLSPNCVTAGGDTDGDGLCDDWEKNGVIVNGVFVNLPAMGADYMHKDIFVQADWMENLGGGCGPTGCTTPGHTHKPDPEAIALVTEAFAGAPVDNPDGTTGITLHVDCGPDCIMNPLNGDPWGIVRSQAKAVPEVPILGGQLVVGNCVALHICQYDWTPFAQIEGANFDISRVPIFHYMIFGHELGMYGAAGQLLHMTGLSQAIPQSNFVVSLGNYKNQVGSTLQQAGTFMHELGHNLGLHHGGYDDTNYKPNYLSVMNYLFQFDGLTENTFIGHMDYSQFTAIPNLNEGALNETVGLNGGAVISIYGTSYYCPGSDPDNNPNVGLKSVPNANGNIDWDCDTGAFETSIPPTDINGNGMIDGIIPNPPLQSSEDWNHLIYNGGAIGASGVGAPPATYQNSDPETAVPVNSQAPFRVEVGGPGLAQILPGTSLNLTFTANNIGLQADTYNLSAVSAFDWWTTSGMPSTLTLAGGASQQITIPVSVSGCITPGTRGQFTIKAVSQSSTSIADSAIAVLLVLPNPPGSVGVPAVVGLSQAAAQAAIVNAGLLVGTVTTQSSTTVPAGTVISQSPIPCGTVAAGTLVSLTVSSGPPPVAVPNIVGGTQNAAYMAMNAAGLVVGTITQTSSSTVPQGNVMSQTPTAGTLVASGSMVNFVVSSGPPLIAVPNLVGLTEQAAVAALTGAGLAVGTITPQVSSTVAEFIVTAQYYSAGTMTYPGTAISFVFSSGSQQLVQVPVANGPASLTAAGLTVGTITPMLSSTVGTYSLISQDPAAGAFVVVGTPVNVVFSSGPQLIPVPDLVGQWQSFAMQNLYGNFGPNGLQAPFQVTITRQPSTTVPDGYVISENPAAGTPALMFSTVNLVVSSGGPVIAVVPNTVTDPSQYGNVFGIGTASNAVKAINAAGFAVGSVTTQTSATVPPGYVISQNPAGGTSAPWDTSVSLVVSAGGTGDLVIPNVVGLTQNAAVNTIVYDSIVGPLRGDYLTYAFTTQSSATVPADTIISQNPPAGPGALPVYGNIEVAPINLVISAGPLAVPSYSYAGRFAGAPSNGVSGGKGQITPFGMAIDPLSRHIIVGDGGNGLVQILDANGNFLSYFGGRGPCCTGWAGFFPGDGTGDGLLVGRAAAIAVDPVNHNIVVVDDIGCRVLIFNSAGQFQSVFGSRGNAPGQFLVSPFFFPGVAIDPTSENIIVTDTGNNRVQIFNSSGVYLSQFGTFGSGDGQFGYGPSGVAIDPVSRNIIVTDTGTNRVQIFNSAGLYLNQFGTQGQGDGQLEQPYGVAIDPVSHNIVVTELGAGNELTNVPTNRVQIFDSTGHFLSKFGGPGDWNGQLSGSSAGIAVDPVTRNILVGDGYSIEIFALPSSATATTTAVAASVNPSTAGQSVTFTATVAGNSPTGTIQFMDGAGTLGAAVPLTGSMASLTLSTLSPCQGDFGLTQCAGTHPITAVYSGDTSNATSTSAILSEAVLNVSTAAVSSTQNPSTAGQAVRFGASVTGSSYATGTTPSGTVQFLDGSTILGSDRVGPGGSGFLTLSTLSVGTHPITVMYSGDDANTPSTSAVLNQVVSAATPTMTTTIVVASINPSTAGQSVTFTATVTGSNPTGAIQFMDGSAALGAPVALTGVTATATLSTLSAGTHPITAVYSGDSSNATSTSAVLSEVVSPVTPPVVTPPASISIPATQAGGATGSASPALAAFLGGGSAVAGVGPSPTRLPSQAGGVSVDNTTLFPVGTTTVTFRFQDASGNIGAATSTVTVVIGTPRITGSVAGVGTDPSGAIYVNVVLTNTGTGNARNLKITSLAFRTLSGTGTVTGNSTLSPSLPITIGNLDVGTAVTTRVFLNVPGTATRISITENGPVQNVLGTNYNYSTAESLLP